MSEGLLLCTFCGDYKINCACKDGLTPQTPDDRKAALDEFERMHKRMVLDKGVLHSYNWLEPATVLAIRSALIRPDHAERYEDGLRHIVETFHDDYVIDGEIVDNPPACTLRLYRTAQETLNFTAYDASKGA